MEYFDDCRAFLEEHIYSLRMDDLPEGERTYRIEHSLRVAKYAKMIAEADGYDIQVCVLAGLLHDVGKFESDENIDHGRVSAEVARGFLETLTMPQRMRDDIRFCIAVHVDDVAGYEYERIPEAEAVSDADNIDRFGVYRIFQALHYDNFDAMPLDEKLEYCKKRVERLEKLSSAKMGTATGTRMFNEACRVQAEYFKKLLWELELTGYRGE